MWRMEVRRMWIALTSWGVVGPVCGIILACGIAITLGGTIMNLPYEFTLARVCYAIGFSLLLIRVGYWLAFEQPDNESRIARLLVTALIFASVGILWVASVMWATEREHRLIASVKPKIKVAAYSSASGQVQQWLF